MFAPRLVAHRSGTSRLLSMSLIGDVAASPMLGTTAVSRQICHRQPASGESTERTTMAKPHQGKNALPRAALQGAVHTHTGHVHDAVEVRGRLGLPWRNGAGRIPVLDGVSRQMAVLQGIERGEMTVRPRRAGGASTAGPL